MLPGLARAIIIMTTSHRIQGKIESFETQISEFAGLNKWMLFCILHRRAEKYKAVVTKLQTQTNELSEARAKLQNVAV
jgi:hypothetical protein